MNEALSLKDVFQKLEFLYTSVDKNSLISAISDLMCASPRTVRHWRATGRAPFFVHQFLLFLLTGLPLLNPRLAREWDGWRFIPVETREPVPGRKRARVVYRLALQSPYAREPFMPDDLRDWQSVRAENRSLRERLGLSGPSQLEWKALAPCSGRAWHTPPGVDQLEETLTRVLESFERRRYA